MPDQPDEAPFFSIIIPTFNCGHKIEATIRSILDQEGATREIIVVDGGSADGTQQLLQSYAEKVRWVSEKDEGIYDAMNKGIDMADGKYLYFMGAGDRLREGTLARIQEQAPAQGMAIVYGDVYTTLTGLVHGHGRPYETKWLAHSGPCHQALFYDRSIFQAVGKFETQYKISADWVLNIKCFGRKDIQKVYVPTIVADYEGGGASWGAQDPVFKRNHKRLKREHLQFSLADDICLTIGRSLRALEDGLAGRIEHSPTNLARRFWLAQLWLVHKGVRPCLSPLLKRYRKLVP